MAPEEQLWRLTSGLHIDTPTRKGREGGGKGREEERKGEETERSQNWCGGWDTPVTSVLWRLRPKDYKF